MWQLADDDATVLVRPGEGVIAYFRFAKDAMLAAQAPAMAEALEKVYDALQQETCGRALEPHEQDVLREIRAILAAIKGAAAPTGPCWPSSAMEGGR